jgi:hypothetical protein
MIRSLICVSEDGSAIVCVLYQTSTSQFSSKLKDAGLLKMSVG